jgi:hypothetical protein
VSVIVKPKKEDYGEETKFNGVEVLDIIFQYWFPIDSNFQLLEFKDKDENEDNSSTKQNPDMNCKGLIPSL